MPQLAEHDGQRPPIGIVLIGRNEGDRLVASLRSLPQDLPCVYVDSGSTDGSVCEAQLRGVAVVNIDPTNFSAAHARNQGVRELLRNDAAIEFIQFLDGDCILQPDWIDRAKAFLVEHADVAIACGRRREIAPERSVFNRLCDLEWDTPVGQADASGGDALIRTTAFLQVNGFREGMIAGEEPELCVRLRHLGWRVVRLDAEMTRHDAAIVRLRQWWRRASRAGHAFAEGASLHPALWKREVRSIVVWGLIVPILILLSAISWPLTALVAFVLYPLLAAKVYLQARRRWSNSDSLLYAIGCIAAKFPQAQGLVLFHANRMLRRRTRIIEYKTPAEGTS